MQHDHEVERLLKLTERAMHRSWAEILDELAERRRAKQEKHQQRKEKKRVANRD